MNSKKATSAALVAALTSAQQISVLDAVKHIHSTYGQPGEITGIDFDKSRVEVTHEKEGESLKNNRAFTLRAGKRAAGTHVVYYSGKERVCAPTPDTSKVASTSKSSSTAVKTTAISKPKAEKPVSPAKSEKLIDVAKTEPASDTTLKASDFPSGVPTVPAPRLLGTRPGKTAKTAALLKTTRALRAPANSGGYLN